MFLVGFRWSCLVAPLVLSGSVSRLLLSGSVSPSVLSSSVSEPPWFCVVLSPEPVGSDWFCLVAVLSGSVLVPRWFCLVLYLGPVGSVWFSLSVAVGSVWFCLVAALKVHPREEKVHITENPSLAPRLLPLSPLPEAVYCSLKRQMPCFHPLFVFGSSIKRNCNQSDQTEYSFLLMHESFYGK